MEKMVNCYECTDGKTDDGQMCYLCGASGRISFETFKEYAEKDIVHYVRLRHAAIRTIEIAKSKIRTARVVNWRAYEQIKKLERALEHADNVILELITSLENERNPLQ